MFIYTHKGINFWWVFAWNIFVLQVGIISDNRWKPTVSLALTNDISEFPLPHNMFTVQNRIVVVFGLLFFFSYFLGELDICLNFVKVRKHRSKLMTRIKEHYIELTPPLPKKPPKNTNKQKKNCRPIAF